jgi:hypothetical protein
MKDFARALLAQALLCVEFLQRRLDNTEPAEGIAERPRYPQMPPLEPFEMEQALAHSAFGRRSPLLLPSNRRAIERHWAAKGGVQSTDTVESVLKASTK